MSRRYVRYPRAYRPQGRVHYYFCWRDAAGRRRIQSTGRERRDAADAWVRDFIDRNIGIGAEASFLAYQKPFFVWATCPHVRRRLRARQTIGRLHVEYARKRLDRWALTDPILPGLAMNRTTRGDLLDFRERLCERVPKESTRCRGDGLATVNHVVRDVCTVYSEAHFRGDIPSNPAAGVGSIVYDERRPDILTLAELRNLFAEPWTDKLAYAVFRHAAGTGMRCSEILALPVAALQGNVLRIDHAWKHRADTEAGAPKWGKSRAIVLAEYVRADLEARIGDRTDGLVFAWADGTRLHETWWRKAFARGLKERGIEAGGRHLVPHSLRHSLNTHLLEAGLDPMRIQLYLWGSRAALAQAPVMRVTTVQPRYTHFQASMTEPVAEAVERLLGPERAANRKAAG